VVNPAPETELSVPLLPLVPGFETTEDPPPPTVTVIVQPEATD